MKDEHDEDLTEDSVVSRIMNSWKDDQEVEEVFQCGMCGEKFIMERYLDMHTKYYHRSCQVFKCSECEAEYK